MVKQAKQPKHPKNPNMKKRHNAFALEVKAYMNANKGVKLPEASKAVSAMRKGF